METREVGISVINGTVPATVLVEMTLPVARTFRNILAHIGGNPRTTGRKDVNQLRKAFDNAGIDRSFERINGTLWMTGRTGE